METKVCTRCGEDKSLGEFVKDKRSKDGYTLWCKKCRKVKEREREKKGLCIVCGEEKPAPKKKTCKKCLAEKTVIRHKQIEERILNKKCTKCGKDNDNLKGQTCSICRGKGLEKRNGKRKEGFCTICGEKVEQEGFLCCDTCLEKAKKYYKENKETVAEKIKQKRQQHIEERYCVCCRGKLKEEDGEFKMCIDCREKDRERGKGQREGLRQQGLCVNCGREREDRELKSCRKCRGQTSDRNRERKEKNLCLDCGESVEDNNFILCEECREKTKMRNKNIKEERTRLGLCATCGTNENILPIENPGYISFHKRKYAICENCWFKGIAKTNLRSVKPWEEIKELFYKQKGLCAESGIKLVLGVNASLDHYISRNDDGRDDISNLQWIDWNINNMKGAMSQKDFISYMEKILTHLGYEVKKKNENSKAA